MRWSSTGGPPAQEEQAARDVTPLREALYGAIAYVESQARRRTPA